MEVEGEGEPAGTSDEDELEEDGQAGIGGARLKEIGRNRRPGGKVAKTTGVAQGPELLIQIVVDQRKPKRLAFGFRNVGRT